MPRELETTPVRGSWTGYLITCRAKWYLVQMYYRGDGYGSGEWLRPECCDAFQLLGWVGRRALHDLAPGLQGDG